MIVDTHNAARHALLDHASDANLLVLATDYSPAANAWEVHHRDEDGEHVATITRDGRVSVGHVRHDLPRRRL